MKIAYLILAHKDPKHLARLINALSTENSCFFIHLDLKSNINDFEHIKGENISFTNTRVSVYYYDYSILNATFILLHTALSHRKIFDYFILLSGNDYPIQPTEYIEGYLMNNFGKDYIDISPFLLENPYPSNRISKYQLSHYDSYFLGKTYYSLVRKYYSKIDRIQEFKKFNLSPYWGSGWWILTRDSCRYVSKWVSENKKFMRFAQHIRIPDEMVFQLILGNSPLKEKAVNSLTYIDWSAKKSHPEEIVQEHLEFFSKDLLIRKNGIEYLFARKFSDKNSVIVDQLDNIIIEKRKLHVKSSTN